MQINPEDVYKASSAIERADLLVVQLEIPIIAVQAAIEVARAAGVKVLLNAAPANLACLDWFDRLEWLVINESEAETLSGLPADQADSAFIAARTLRGRGAKTVVLTMGEQGAWWVGQEEKFFPAFRIQAVDTTAAGDAFIGGLAVSLGRGDDWQSATRFASAAGALAATRLGAQTSLPDLHELERFIAEN